MYNFIEYISNYFYTTGSLWFFSKVEATSLMLILRKIMLLNLSSMRLNY